MVNKEQMEHYR